MKVKASFLFAYRLLFPKTGKKSNARKSLFGAFLCIGISLVPLVMVLTVSNGMIEGITERMIGLLSSHIECSLYPDTQEAQSAQDLRAFSEKLKKIPGVTNVYPEIQSVALAAGSFGRCGATVRAVENDLFEKNPAFKSLFEIIDIADTNESEKNAVLIPQGSAIIGQKLAENLDLSAGSVFRLITTKVLSSGKIIPKITTLKVFAVVSCGYQELDALWVFIPLESGFSVLPVLSSRIIAGVETQDAFSGKIDLIMREVERNVPNFTGVRKWSELNSAEYENFSSTQIMLLFIMMLIVLVASVNISSALVMLVKERRKEIAILKSLGASSNGIAFSFMITGLITGFAGVLVGIPSGLLCAVNFNEIINFIEKTVNFIAKFVYVLSRGNSGNADFNAIHLLDPAFYLQNIPVSIPLPQLLMIACGTLILSLSVSVFPAIKAGREKPIETLRKI